MAPNNGRRNGRSAADRAEAALEALRLRRQGLGYDAIGEHLGVSPRTASRRVHAALRDLIGDSAAEYRNLIELRLDELRQWWMEQLGDRTGKGSDVARCLNGLAAVERDRVRLLGLAIPAKVIVELETNGEITEEDNDDAA